MGEGKPYCWVEERCRRGMIGGSLYRLRTSREISSLFLSTTRASALSDVAGERKERTLDSDDSD